MEIGNNPVRYKVLILNTILAFNPGHKYETWQEAHGSCAYEGS